MHVSDSDNETKKVVALKQLLLPFNGCFSRWSLVSQFPTGSYSTCSRREPL